MFKTKGIPSTIASPSSADVLWRVGPLEGHNQALGIEEESQTEQTWGS